MPHKTKAEINTIVELYTQGFSCGKIGLIFGMSRQAVWERLKRAGVVLRQKKILPFIMYDGIKFTPSLNGYYRATHRHKHTSLHRYKYEKEVGKILEGYDIHHRDNNRQNNRTTGFRRNTLAATLQCRASNECNHQETLSRYQYFLTRSHALHIPLLVHLQTS